MAFKFKFIKPLMAERAEFWGQSTKGADQLKLWNDCVDNEPESSFAGKLKPPLSASRCTSPRGSPTARRFVFSWLQLRAAAVRSPISFAVSNEPRTKSRPFRI